MKATTALDKMSFGRFRILVAKAADDDARYVDEFAMNLQDPCSRHQLSLNPMRGSAERHEGFRQSHQEFLAGEHSYIVVNKLVNVPTTIQTHMIR